MCAPLFRWLSPSLSRDYRKLAWAQCPTHWTSRRPWSLQLIDLCIQFNKTSYTATKQPRTDDVYPLSFNPVSGSSALRNQVGRRRRYPYTWHPGYLWPPGSRRRGSTGYDCPASGPAAFGYTWAWLWGAGSWRGGHRTALCARTQKASVQRQHTRADPGSCTRNWWPSGWN